MTRWSAYRLEWALLAALVAMALAMLAWAMTRPAPAIASDTMSLVEAEALIDATQGEEFVDYRATGETAEMINASLPFDRAGLDPARPFAAPTGRDLARAQHCLTQAIYYEAGFEPRQGQRAVAQVVLNRVRHPAFPNTVCGVVYQGARAPVCQFSFTCDGALDRAPVAWAWADARDVAKAALGGTVESSVGTATHYHADYVAPKWAPMLTKVDKIGAHIFYRWPGNWGRRGAFVQSYGGEPLDAAALRPIARKDADELIAAVEDTLPAGPPIARAENDVGGYLDTSKGWTLNIPAPEETNRAANAVAARQAPREQLASSADVLPGGGE